MKTYRLDALVDAATHAVNALIPESMLHVLEAKEHLDLLADIKAALTPLLCDLADRAGESAAGHRSRTRLSTMVAFVSELIETHIDKCERERTGPGDGAADIVSDTFGTRANIASLATASNEAENEACIYIVLDDGGAFRLMIERTAKL
ncbi:MAG: hypothetical protein J7498_01260 [Sphingobium sp.]|nr:hypothetical protein [Sphingobium sp.]